MLLFTQWPASGIDETMLRADKGFSLKTDVSPSSSQMAEWGRRYCIKNNIAIKNCLYPKGKFIHAVSYIPWLQTFCATRKKVKTRPHSWHCLHIKTNTTCKLTTSGTYTWTTNAKFLYDTCPFIIEIIKQYLQFIWAHISWCSFEIWIKSLFEKQCFEKLHDRLTDERQIISNGLQLEICGRFLPQVVNYDH